MVMQEAASLDQCQRHNIGLTEMLLANVVAFCAGTAIEWALTAIRLWSDRLLIRHSKAPGSTCETNPCRLGQRKLKRGTCTLVANIHNQSQAILQGTLWGRGKLP